MRHAVWCALLFPGLAHRLSELAHLELQVQGQASATEPPVPAVPELAPREPPRHKRFVGGYGRRTAKQFSQLWTQLNEPGQYLFKGLVAGLLFVQFAGPFLLFKLLQTSLVQATAEYRARSQLLTKIVDSLMCPLANIAFGICSNFVIVICLAGTDKDFPLLNDIHWCMGLYVLLFVIMAVLRTLAHVDASLGELVQDRVTSEAFQKRQEFLSGISGTGSLEADEHGAFLYRYVWRPIYAMTVSVISIFFLIVAAGFSAESYVLLVGYCIFVGALAIFGGHTLGPELYGGIVLFLDKPFAEGDIITLDKRNSQGGAQTDVTAAVVTGFVERIGLRSTVIRRFDMRSVWVPNSYFAQYAVANWSTRPRKLIHFEFTVSHKTDAATLRSFQQQLAELVQSHPQIDHSMYSKAVFRSLDTGLGAVVICFTAKGAKKQIVQQDLLLRVLQLAQDEGVRLTFRHGTLEFEQLEREGLDGQVASGATDPDRSVDSPNQNKENSATENCNRAGSQSPRQASTQQD